MKILFLLHAPKINASARYRVYNYLPFLEKVGIHYTVIPSHSVEVIRKLTQEVPKWILKTFHLGELGNKVFRRLLLGIYNIFNTFILNPYHFFAVLCSMFYDLVFIQSMIHPGMKCAFLEKLLFRINASVVYDIDDALYTIPNISAKIQTLLNKSKIVITSTDNLAQYIKQYNYNVEVISDPMDFYYYQQKSYKIEKNGPIVIGWIGQGRNLKFLALIENALKQIAKDYDIRLKVVSSQDYALDGVNVINKRWKMEDEVQDLLTFDIGINPMFDDEYGRAKNSLKLQQYLAVGLPAISSQGGLSKEIYQHGENVLFARTQDEWMSHLAYLIENPQERERIGRNGRITMKKWFSIEKAALRWLNILSKCKFERGYEATKSIP